MISTSQKECLKPVISMCDGGHYFQTRQAYFSQAMDEGPSGDDRKINLHVTSPFASLTVR